MDDELPLKRRGYVIHFFKFWGPNHIFGMSEATRRYFKVGVLTVAEEY